MVWTYVDSNNAYDFFLLKNSSYWYVRCVYKKSPHVWHLQGFSSREKAEEQIAFWKIWMNE